MLTILLKREGYEVTLAPGFNAGRDALANANEPYALMLTDLMMPDGSGLDLLSVAKERNQGTEVIVMTAHSTVETALEAMRRGAYDFVAKPLEKRDIRLENTRLKALTERGKGTGLVGHSEAMQKLEALIVRIAPAKTTVLITGESGTGKERIARAVHECSDRGAANKPFLVVNCGAFPEALIEAELFGHEKGAFTGAVTRKLGIFREAEGGTVFLDEIGELPLSMQVKLLRVIQEKKVRGVGESQESSVDVRVLAATNRNVEDEVKNGKFRQDLYYRLNVIRIEVPPLRERREDLADLLAFFIDRASREHNKEIRGFSTDARRALDAYAYPGNVRELENIVERAAALSAGTIIGLGDLPREVAGHTAEPTPALVELGEGCELEAVLAEIERRLILQALERSGGVRTGAAKLLGITFRSLRYRMAKLGLSDDDGDGNVEGGEADPLSSEPPQMAKPKVATLKPVK
jgi:two-component system, NtrC family, response regulator PilR